MDCNNPVNDRDGVRHVDARHCDMDADLVQRTDGAWNGRSDQSSLSLNIVAVVAVVGLKAVMEAAFPRLNQVNRLVDKAL